MSISEILNIVLIALSLIVGFLSVYYKGNSKLVKAVTGYISEAEGIYTGAKSGATKMQYVCGKLYSLLPAVIRPFIPESVIQTVVQTIFDQIAKYATLQLDKAVDAATQYTGKVIGTVPDTAAKTTTATGTAEANQTQQVTSGLSDTAQ